MLHEVLRGIKFNYIYKYILSYVMLCDAAIKSSCIIANNLLPMICLIFPTIPYKTISKATVPSTVLVTIKL